MLANKQDVRRALVPGLLADALALSALEPQLKVRAHTRPAHPPRVLARGAGGGGGGDAQLGFTVRGCSARDRHGLQEALTWLLEAAARCNGGTRESPPVWEV